MKLVIALSLLIMSSAAFANNELRNRVETEIIQKYEQENATICTYTGSYNHNTDLLRAKFVTRYDYKCKQHVDSKVTAISVFSKSNVFGYADVSEYQLSTKINETENRY